MSPSSRAYRVAREGVDRWYHHAVGALDRWTMPANAWLGHYRSDLAPIILLLLALLVLTHLALASIMWVQRPWTRVQRAMFWFAVGKDVFWLDLLKGSVVHYNRAPITVEGAAILLVVLVPTAWLDVEIYRSFVLGVSDKPAARQANK